MQDTITKPLLKWYGENKRVLPWREKKNPYEIWVSEIMLQQTRVEAVKPFYERFMRELPNVAALAVCPEEKLLKLWEGLGYYNRVRNMQNAAQKIISGRLRSLKRTSGNWKLHSGSRCIDRVLHSGAGGGRKCASCDGTPPGGR